MCPISSKGEHKKNRILTCMILHVRSISANIYGSPLKPETTEPTILPVKLLRDTFCCCSSDNELEIGGGFYVLALALTQFYRLANILKPETLSTKNILAAFKAHKATLYLTINDSPSQGAF